MVVFGNHENYNRLLQCPLIDIGIGDEVYEVYKDNVYYLQRGHIYNIEGKNILALGGALSVDKAFRQEHINWWREELWSFNEEKAILELLKTKNKFDYVVSHTGPMNINHMLPIEKLTIIDKVAVLNNVIDELITYNTFFAGHYHLNWQCTHNNKTYIYLYKHGLEVVK
jgi:hypothetical protein